MKPHMGGGEKGFDLSSIGMTDVQSKGMRYRVQAKLKPGVGSTFYRKLTDGSIEQQKPDGREILASMQRAVVLEGGTIAWTETCYCDPPLKHERGTVYDSFFDEFVTEPLEGDAPNLEGASFWERLQVRSGSSG